MLISGISGVKVAPHVRKSKNPGISILICCHLFILRGVE